MRRVAERFRLPLSCLLLPALFLPEPATASAAQAGTIVGVVRLAGDSLPEPTRVRNTTDPEVCGRRHTLQDLLVSPDGRGVRNVIVALTDVSPEAIGRPRPRTLVLDNRDCRFVPHVAVVAVGDTIVAANSDSTLHNTHYYGALRANIGLPVAGLRARRVAERAGMVSVKCDVHGWMQAYLRVDPHRLHAVTDGEGGFRIPGVPPGTHTVEFWHETFGSIRSEVRVEPGRTARVEVEYAMEGERTETSPSTGRTP